LLFASFSFSSFINLQESPTFLLHFGNTPIFQSGFFPDESNCDDFLNIGAIQKIKSMMASLISSNSTGKVEYKNISPFPG
jgi:hypothetical protein